MKNGMIDVSLRKRIAGGTILKISLLAILLLVSSAGASTTVNVGYVNYDDSGFTGSSTATGNIFSNAIVGGPAHTALVTDSVTYNGMTFTPLKRADISTANLNKYDTVILFEICDISTSLTTAQQTAINAYIASGHKVLLFDADRCATSTGGKADYSWFTFPFATSSPGPLGASGVLTIVENSTLTNGTNDLSKDPFSLDEAGGTLGDELGDANTATTSNSNWCAAAKTTNALGNNGFWLAYARNTGLIIYNGADNWASWSSSKSLTDTFVNMLNQQFNPDGLPCGIRLAPPTGSIAGTKFNDLNHNGTRDTGEPGLANWNITLTNNTGVTITQTTAPDGSYNFTNLTDGNYTVGEVIQPGWVQTAPSVSTAGSAVYTVQIKGGNNVADKDFGNFFDIPSASCVKGPNPSGNIPVAKGGQRPDGFYTLIAIDPLNLNLQIFVKDTGSGTIFPSSPPGFASGTNIKYTQAPGATPSIEPFSGVVAWHITGTGDAAVYAVNSVGNPSPSVSCLVPPPPK